jgi:hypothetical protein
LVGVIVPSNKCIFFFNEASQQESNMDKKLVLWNKMKGRKEKSIKQKEKEMESKERVGIQVWLSFFSI